MNDSSDRRILDDLSAEDRAFLDTLEENRGLYTQLADAFSGPMKFWAAFGFVLSFACAAGAVYMLVRLAAAPPTSEALMWLAGFIALWIGVGLTKIWFWMRMNQVTLLRELKKIELQVVRLAEQQAK